MLTKRTSRLQFTEEEHTIPYLESVSKQIISKAVHRKLHEVEQDNCAVESVHQIEQTVTSNPISRMYQKKRNRKAIRQRVQADFTISQKNTHKPMKKMEFVAKNKHTILVCSICCILILLFTTGITACTALLSGAISSVSGSTFLSKEEDILGTEADYSLMETALQEQIDNIETLYPDYDEYVYTLDEMQHDPYVLSAILSALYPGYTRSEVTDTLTMLFEQQYQLHLSVETETRYRPEERTVYYTHTDGSTYPYTYTVEVAYTYYILNVELVNRDLSFVAKELLDEEQYQMYEIYWKTQGNRPDLF